MSRKTPNCNSSILLAYRINDLIKEIEKETGSCGGNPLFYNEVGEELAKLHPYAIDKLRHIIDNAVVLLRTQE